MRICWRWGSPCLVKQSVPDIKYLYLSFITRSTSTVLSQSHLIYSAHIYYPMLTQLAKRLTILARPYTFATAATRDSLDYYEVLQVDQGATEDSIRKSYADLTTGLIPEFDSKRFKQLNEALVILTDNKTRDAYDSLLAVRKTNYLSAEETPIPATRSYLADRKANKLEQLKKKLNIDEMGRFKGGLPNKHGKLRGVSADETGKMHRPGDIEDALNTHPEFNNVTGEKAESFKSFHQDEREARSMKWPWFTFQVDYDYFTFRTFRKHYWPKIQLFVFLFYILPTLYYLVDRAEKHFALTELKEKAVKAQEAAERKAHAHVAEVEAQQEHASN